MKCQKCDMHYTNVRKETLQELAKGSPSRGKNMKFTTVKYTQYICGNCHSGHIEWS